MSDHRLDVLLIEDNPGDVRLIEEMLRESRGLLERVEVGDATIGGADLHHESTLTDGMNHVDDADVVLLDLGLPESTGIETLATVTDATEFVPIVVLTGLDDEAVGIEAIERGAQDYLVKAEVTSDLLVRSIHHAIERNRQERERARRRDRLRALNRLNRIGHDVTHAVITTSTREELEESVCDRLVESDAYRFAWIGEVDQLNGRITPRAVAGHEDGYLEDVTIELDAGDTADGPAARAVETRTVQVIGDMAAAVDDRDWAGRAIERGYRSGAAIPLFHEELLYGVLLLYADTPEAFSSEEREILARLGDVIGHAITAIERKEALVSDSVLELEFRVDGLARELVAAAGESDATIAFRNVIRTGGDPVIYGHARGLSQDSLETAVTDSEDFANVRTLTAGEDEYEFELTTPALATLAAAIGTHGGSLAAGTIENGQLTIVLEFPPGQDRRQLVTLVEDSLPGATNVAQRTVERSTDDVADFQSVFQHRLTEKQRTALETAYYAGLFEWPRKSTGEEVADRLGVSPPTFTQHLRAAEQKFFDAVFEDPGGDRPE